MIRISTFKLYIKDRVFLATKDFLFIITWLVLLLFIADAFGNEPRIRSYFVWVWEILGILYAWKIAENFQLQKPQENSSEPKLEDNKKTIKSSKNRFFEA